MVRGFNKSIIMGNLTRDPEIRYTSANKAHARFSVAANRVWKDRDGNKQEATDFIPVVVWGPQAEACEKYLAKGRPVLVEGQIRTRSYEAKDGSGKRYVTEIQADNVVFLGGGEKRDEPRRSDENNQGWPDEPFNGSSRQAEPFPMDVSEDGEDQSDIPF